MTVAIKLERSMSTLQTTLIFATQIGKLGTEAGKTRMKLFGACCECELLMTPYQIVYQDAHIGHTLDDNPYDELVNLTAFEAWIEGWKDAQ